ESGAIEQDADMVIFLYRPDYYGIDQDEMGNSLKGVGEVIVAKHRNGSLDNVQLRFIGKYTKFTDLDDSDYSTGGSPLDPSMSSFAEPQGSQTFSSRINDITKGGKDDDLNPPF
ncbi:MAG: DnaB-like helicase C-terminal domain-containing protein, partial [Cytophagaceae bacterium]